MPLLKWRISAAYFVSTALNRPFCNYYITRNSKKKSKYLYWDWPKMDLMRLISLLPWHILLAKPSPYIGFITRPADCCIMSILYPTYVTLISHKPVKVNIIKMWKKFPHKLSTIYTSLEYWGVSKWQSSHVKSDKTAQFFFPNLVHILRKIYINLKGACLTS